MSGDWYSFNNEHSKSKASYNIESVEDYKYSNSTVDSTSTYINLETSRVSRSEFNSDLNNENTLINEPIKNDILRQFLTSTSQTNLNNYNVINSLGVFITNDIKEMFSASGAHKHTNDELDKVHPNFVNSSSSFNGYKSNYNGIAVTENNAENDENLAQRNTVSLGLSMGESLVINPMHQYNKRADPRTNPYSTELGRMYYQNVSAKTPVVLIQPGRVKYNNSFTKMLGLGTGAASTEALIRSGGDGFMGALRKMGCWFSDSLSIVGTLGSGIFGNNKLIEFKQDYNLFKKYASNLYRMVATEMGLLSGGKYVGKYNELNLDNILPGMNLYGGSLIGYQSNQYIPFRCGKGITSTETFSNTMGTNPLEESMNSESEANDDDATGGSLNTFLSGGNFMNNVAAFAKKTLTKASSTFSERGMIMSGKARVSLPEVWSSSNFQRSFSFNFKCHSPYGDDISIFENCYIPFLTLLTMSLPRQVGKMTYTTPFALRINVKSLIMINYGIVENLSVTRGDDVNDWTPTGYPKTLSIDLSIKDLEPNIALPLGSRGAFSAALEEMFPSSGISEYLFSLGALTISDIRTIKARWNRATDAAAGSINSFFDSSTVMSSVANSRTISNIIAAVYPNSMDEHNYNSNPFSSSISKDKSVDHSNNQIGIGDYTLVANGGATKTGVGAINVDLTSDLSATTEINNMLNDGSPRW